MSKIFISEDDLGEAAQFVLDQADETADPLHILLAREDDPDEAFFAALEELLRERRVHRTATFH
ncbi:hypothetical protein [Uliginosibacterium gangwonense]|uniref:hypothetical protein n=1 Tax=Uliginosibacterium gangwonense TaxID=392736 RepID=UPI0003601BE5|nr:hypothetical protein [Uliginosibacterium gangwonense]